MWVRTTRTNCEIGFFDARRTSCTSHVFLFTISHLLPTSVLSSSFLFFFLFLRCLQHTQTQTCRLKTAYSPPGLIANVPPRVCRHLSLGCSNQTPQTRGLKQQKSFSHSPGDWMKDPGPQPQPC